MFRKDNKYLGLVPEGLSDGYTRRRERSSEKLTTGSGRKDEGAAVAREHQNNRLVVAASNFGWQASVRIRQRDMQSYCSSNDEPTSQQRTRRCVAKEFDVGGQERSQGLHPSGPRGKMDLIADGT